MLEYCGRIRHPRPRYRYRCRYRCPRLDSLETSLSVATDSNQLWRSLLSTLSPTPIETEAVAAGSYRRTHWQVQIVAVDEVARKPSQETPRTTQLVGGL